MVTLITNDDGIDAPGLHALARAAVAAGHDVVVAAPAVQASGSSASITAQHDDGSVPSEPRQLPGLEGVPCFAVEAAPALIVLLAAHGAFGAPPDLVLSGVNHGANVGRAVLHSGTVGAALTAGVNGITALASSLDLPTVEHEATADWEGAAGVAARLLPVLAGLDVGTVLNLNVPAGGAADVRLVESPLADFGVVQTTVTEDVGGALRLAVRVPEVHDPDDDAARLASGVATLTALTSVGTVPSGVDVAAL